MNIQLFKTADEAYSASYTDIVSSVDLYSPLSFALSGGKTPIPLYKKLASLPFTNLSLYQVDERYTKDENELNQCMIKGVFADTNAQFHSIDISKEYRDAILNYNIQVGDDFAPDVTVLGVGSDGHFASLFSHDDILHNHQHVIGTRAPSNYTTQKRISLSYNTICKSKKISIIVTGKEKLSAIERLIQNNSQVSYFPAHSLLFQPQISLYYAYENT